MYRILTNKLVKKVCSSVLDVYLNEHNFLTSLGTFQQDFYFSFNKKKKKKKKSALATQ